LGNWWIIVAGRIITTNGKRDQYRSDPSWHGLRIANMPKRTGLILLALLLPGFLAAMFRK
jgi:hypothetical protein